MKVKLLFIITLLLFFVFSFTLLNTTSAFAVSEDYAANALKSCEIKRVFNDEDGKVCIVGISGLQAVCTVTELSGKTYAYIVNLDYPYIASAYSNGRLYLAQNVKSSITDDKMILVLEVNLSNGETNEHIFENTNLFDEYSLAVSNEKKIYMVCEHYNDTVLNIYKSDGTLYKELEHSYSVPTSVWNYGSYIYAFTNSELEIINTSVDSIISVSEKSTQKEIMLSQELFIDKNKALYKLESSSDNRIIKLADGADAAVSVKGGFVYSNGKNVYYHHFENDKNYPFFQSENPVLDIVYRNSQLYFVTVKNGTVDVLRKSSSEISEIINPKSSSTASDEENSNPASNSASKGNNNSSKTSSADKPKSDINDIRSDIYQIKDGKIYNDNGEVTVSSFKKSFSSLNMEITIYKTPKLQKTSGYIGTGDVVYFTDSYGRSKKFTVITIADTNGDGKINTKDYNSIVDSLFDRRHIKGFYLEAGDLNNSGDIDLADWYQFLRDYTH